MTRPIHVFAALLLFALVAPTALAQTRPRRVDQTSSPIATENPLPEKPREEVGEDEVVRVDTTLVTIPVSIRVATDVTSRTCVKKIFTSMRMASNRKSPTLPPSKNLSPSF
jgi:hypothetical protein